MKYPIRLDDPWSNEFWEDLYRDSDNNIRSPVSHKLCNDCIYIQERRGVVPNSTRCSIYFCIMFIDFTKKSLL